MKQFLLIAILLLGWCQAGFSQGQNNFWAFGHGAGLEFNNGTVTAFTDSMLTESACAAVASSSGNLLFYTNGTKIWNRNHQVMPNGTGLLGNYESTFSQGAVIVPFIEDTNKYYVFYMKDYNATQEDDLYYSVVDMSLSNGLGDVVSGQKNTWVDSGMSTSLTAVPGTNCNVWLVAHLRDTNIAKSYEITASGIDLLNPVVSTAGQWTGPYAYETSMMKASPDHQKIGLSNFTIASSNGETLVFSGIELLSFDQATGQVISSEVIDLTPVSFYNFLSMEFSPDGSKLYACAPFLALFGSSSVYQYDLSLGNLTAIQASKTALGSPVLVSDLKRAPDGKIYVTSSFGVPATTIDAISSPNVAGVACNYTVAAVTLQNGTYATSTLPTFVTLPEQDTFSGRKDTVICNGQGLAFTLPAGYFHYYFQGNKLDSTVVHIDTPGTYYFEYDNYCEWHADTLHVSTFNLNAGLKDTSLCSNDFKLTLDASGTNPAGTGYLWSDGSRLPGFDVTKPGAYWVKMSVNGCQDTDTVTIGEIVAPEVYLGPDTTICLGEKLILEGPPADSFLWQDGSEGRKFNVSQTGKYTLTAFRDGCSDTSSVLVSIVDCNCNLFVPNAFSPNGDGLNDKFEPKLDCNSARSTYKISIYNRFGQRVFLSYRADDAWDGTFNGQKQDMGTYFYRIEYENWERKLFVRQGDLTLLR